MRRVMLPVVVGFALGIGGATGIVVAREREAQSVAVARKVDAAKASARPADSSAAGTTLRLPAAASDPAALADSLALAAASGAPAPPVDDTASAGVPAGAPIPVPAASRDTVAAPTARTALEGGKISKIFNAMQPREAARVMEQMDDADVQAILASLGDRRAAAILASLPPQRAAAITRGRVQARMVAP